MAVVKRGYDRSRLAIPVGLAAAWGILCVIVMTNAGLPWWVTVSATAVQMLIVFTILEGLAVRDEAARERNIRNVAIAISLFVLVNLFFAVTIVRLGGNVAERLKIEGKPAAPTRVITEPTNGGTSNE
ncbi:MAG: hypothetical protein AAFZ01_06085 [Pseudomonadota bacterium]